MDPIKSIDKATHSAFALVLCGYAAALFPELLRPGIPLLVLAAVAGVALLYLCAGLQGASAVPPDLAGRFWPLARVLSCGFLLVQQRYLPRAWGAWAQTGTQGIYVAMIAAGLLRFLLLMRGLGRNELPDPSKVPGMPLAGPASPHAAHAAINRHRAPARRPWWKFWN